MTARCRATSSAWSADGSSANIDFAVDRDANGDLFLTPVRAGTGVEYYDATTPVEDLTSVDFAADQTYQSTPDPGGSRASAMSSRWAAATDPSAMARFG